jgi:hypothetical protein
MVTYMKLSSLNKMLVELTQKGFIDRTRITSVVQLKVPGLILSPGKSLRNSFTVCTTGDCTIQLFRLITYASLG